MLNERDDKQLKGSLICDTSLNCENNHDVEKNIRSITSSYC